VIGFVFGALATVILLTIYAATTNPSPDTLRELVPPVLLGEFFGMCDDIRVVLAILGRYDTAVAELERKIAHYS